MIESRNSSDMEPNGSKNNVKIVCRFRPINSAEEKFGKEITVNFPSNQENIVSMGKKHFKFDKVFKPDTSQESVYNQVAKPVLQHILCGYNGTIMAYGQTSSGKTFTMDGVVGDAHLGGIVPRLVGELFDHVTSMNEKSHFQIKVSFFEIYLEKIRDLIDSSKVNLSIHEDVRKV
ncbi:kinesin heavy chain-like protein, partial [Dinothrombium tinctorium]